MRYSFRFLGLLAAGLLAGGAAWAQAPVRPKVPLPPAPSEEQSYTKEIVYGINFNTQGGLIGGVNFRSAHVIDDQWLRFWSLEGVSFKNPKEESTTNRYTGGSFVRRKTNYAFSLRPSYGVQRILFRKAADAGVQVNALLSAGPSLGLLMPYYITYDYTAARTNVLSNSDPLVNEQYDPDKHTVNDAIIDRAPIFTGIGETKLVPGFHLRGGLSFEYGRYRDAVAGAEVGFMIEGYTRALNILSPLKVGDSGSLNHQFFPSVYLTMYIGHRS